MQLAEIEICRFTEDLWQIVLGLPVRRRIGLAMPDGACVTGSVAIRGGWRGAVVLECAEPVARHAASVMFGMDAGKIEPPESSDCVRELTNIIAGNLKSVFPGPSSLGVPSVELGPARENPGSRVVARLAFETPNGLIFVSLLEQGSEDEDRRRR